VISVIFPKKTACIEIYCCFRETKWTDVKPHEPPIVLHEAPITPHEAPITPHKAPIKKYLSESGFTG
jgi:hypothetical protein